MKNKFKNFTVQVSHRPEDFVFSLMNGIKIKSPSITENAYVKQIIRKYQFAKIFPATSLYFLQFPKTFGNISRNLSKHLSVISRFYCFPILLKNSGFFKLINLLEKNNKNVYRKKFSYLSNSTLLFRDTSTPAFAPPKARRIKQNVEAYVSTVKISQFIPDTLLFRNAKSAISRGVDKESMKSDYYLATDIQLPYTTIYNKVSTFFTHLIVRNPLVFRFQKNAVLKHHHNMRNESRSNILKDMIWEIKTRSFISFPIIPLKKIRSFSRSLSKLSNLLLESHLLYDKAVPEENHSRIDKQERAKDSLIENTAKPHFQLLKSSLAYKRARNCAVYTTFLNNNFNYLKQKYMTGKYSFLKGDSGNLNIVDRKKKDRDISYYWNLETKNNISIIDNPLTHIETEKVKKGYLPSRYRQVLPELNYFASPSILNPSEITQRTEEGKAKDTSLSDSYHTGDFTRTLSPSDTGVTDLADKVYGIIFERIKREKKMRGH